MSKSTQGLAPGMAWLIKNLSRKETGIFFLVVAVCIFGGFKVPHFLDSQNLQNNAELIGLYGIFSLTAGMVIITGGIDLSVGSIFALTGVILAMLLNPTEDHWPKFLQFLDGSHFPWPIVVVIVIGLGMGLGTLHGYLITRVKLQPFIVTLCGLLFYRGMAQFITDERTKGFSNAKTFEPLMKFATEKVPLKLFGVGPQFPFSMPFLILIFLSIIMWIVLHRSVYGRHLFAVGRNEEAARFSGINTKRVIASAYIVSGIFAGIAGILIAFYSGSISPSQQGNSFELWGIAAAVLGGCSLRGGEGSVIGILLGVVLIRVLVNQVDLLGISTSLTNAVVGAVILLGVLSDQLLTHRAKSRRSKA